MIDEKNIVALVGAIQKHISNDSSASVIALATEMCVMYG